MTETYTQALPSPMAPTRPPPTTPRVNTVNPPPRQNGEKAALPSDGDKKQPTLVDRFPALNLITALLRSVSTTDHQRGARMLAQVRTTGVDVYSTILAAVDELRSTKANDASTRRFLFEGYTTAAYTLEVFLLSLPKTYFIPAKDASLTLPPDTSTEEAVQYIRAWRSEREQLTRAWAVLNQQGSQNKFLSSRVPVNVDYNSHRLQDDQLIVQALLNFFEASKLTDKDLIQGKVEGEFVTDVIEMSEDLIEAMSEKWSQPSAAETSALLIRALMLIYIPFALIAAPQTTLDWKLYLRSASLWADMKGFLTKVKAQLDAPGSVTEKEFTAMEDRLVKLGEVSIDTSPEMTAFCADAVPNTPRPFLFRTVAIVRTLEHLDQYSLLPQNKALNGHRYDLKLAMQDVHADLRVIFDGADGNMKTFSPTSHDHHERSSKLQQSFAKISSLFEKFGITKEWPKQELVFKDMWEKDHKNIEMVKSVAGF